MYLKSLELLETECNVLCRQVEDVSQHEFYLRASKIVTPWAVIHTKSVSDVGSNTNVSWHFSLFTIRDVPAMSAWYPCFLVR